MKRLILVLCFILESLSLFSQDFGWETKRSYNWHFIKCQTYGGFPESVIQGAADSISDILDSIGVSRYNESFNEAENRFLNDFSKLLQFNPHNTDSTCKYLTLCSQHSRYFLKSHSNDLLPYCFDYKNNVVQRNILALLDISKELKDSLLLYPKWERWERASLGDTIAENEYIDSFHNKLASIKTEQDMDYLLEYGHILLAIGTERSLKTYIAALDCNKVFKRDMGECQYMISALGKMMIDYSMHSFFHYYPQYCLLSPDYALAHRDGDSFRPYPFCAYPTHFEERYVEQIEKFCLEEFGIELHVDIPFLILSKYNYYLSDKEVNYILDKFR